MNRPLTLTLSRWERGCVRSLWDDRETSGVVGASPVHAGAAEAKALTGLPEIDRRCSLSRPPSRSALWRASRERAGVRGIRPVSWPQGASKYWRSKIPMNRSRPERRTIDRTSNVHLRTPNTERNRWFDVPPSLPGSFPLRSASFGGQDGGQVGVGRSKFDDRRSEHPRPSAPIRG
jgi:hypothetical protein